MKSDKRKPSVSAIIFLVALALLTNFFVAPTPGVTDGIGGWPIVQADSSGDSTSSVVAQEDTETEESDTGLLTLLWDIAQIRLCNEGF